MAALIWIVYCIGWMFPKMLEEFGGISAERDRKRALKAYYAMPYYSKKEFSNRVEYYNAQGQLHRTDGPAREYANGLRVYIVNGHLWTKEAFSNEYANK